MVGRDGFISLSLSLVTCRRRRLAGPFEWRVGSFPLLMTTSARSRRRPPGGSRRVTQSEDEGSPFPRWAGLGCGSSILVYETTARFRNGLSLDHKRRLHWLDPSNSFS